MNPNQNESEINLSSSTFGNQSASPHASVLYSKFQPSNDLPFVVRALIKTKMVRNEAQAQKLILTVVLAFIIVAAVFFILSFNKPAVSI
jgi:hypothetical protein